jgi:uncharacterized membrane protein YgdD (TMEM256/DUF423 family)
MHCWGTTTSFCNRVLHTTSFSSFVIDLLGVSTADLATDVKGAIVSAVHSILPEAAENDISVDNIVDVDAGVEVSITVGVDVGALGFNYDDMESIPYAHDTVENAFKMSVGNGALVVALVSGSHRSGLEKVTGTLFIEGHLVFNGDMGSDNMASQEYVKDFYTGVAFENERTGKEDSPDKLKHDLWLTEKYGVYAVAAAGYLVFAGVAAALVVYALRNPQAGVAAVKEVGEGVGEALVSYVADEEDMVLDSKGRRAVLPSVTKLPALAAKKVRNKVAGGVDRVGYKLVTTLDDIADGVVDMVLPPENSESDSDAGQ